MRSTFTDAEWSREFERAVDATPASEDYDPFKENEAMRERNLKKALNLHKLGKKKSGK